MGVPFTVIPSDFDEYLDDTVPAAQMAIELGLGKARKVAEQHPDALVIGSDTIVTLNGRHLGKAQDEVEARQMLKDHGGQTAIITTSVALVCKELNLEIAKADESKAVFKPTDETALEAYLATGDWSDKAGAWGIQNGADVLVDHISGAYDTILGLPTAVLAEMLQSQGIEAQVVRLVAPVPNKA